MHRVLTNLFALLALTVLAGCASVDYDYPREDSFYLADTADTRLARSIQPVVAAQPADQSGFHPLIDAPLGRACVTNWAMPPSPA